MNNVQKSERLLRSIQKVERAFTAHHDVPGHPEFCVQGVVIVKTWDCLLGSPESAANLMVDATASLSDPYKTVEVLKRAVKWMEYDIAVREYAKWQEAVGVQPTRLTSSLVTADKTREGV